MDAQLVSNKCDLKFLCTFYCGVKSRLEHERDSILNLCFGRKKSTKTEWKKQKRKRAVRMGETETNWK